MSTDAVIDIDLLLDSKHLYKYDAGTHNIYVRFSTGYNSFTLTNIEIAKKGIYGSGPNVATHEKMTVNFTGIVFYPKPYPVFTISFDVPSSVITKVTFGDDTYIPSGDIDTERQQTFIKQEGGANPVVVDKENRKESRPVDKKNRKESRCVGDKCKYIFRNNIKYMCKYWTIMVYSYNDIW